MLSRLSLSQRSAKFRIERSGTIEMSRIAFIFPGQGSQYVGMGKDFYDTYEEAKSVYQLAGEVSGLDMEALCFTENDKINITEYTQIAMLATEVAILKVLESKGVSAEVTAGLSLGEYGALAAADVMDLKDLFYIIRKRGIFMQEEYPVGGAMTAVLGLDSDKIEEICRQTEGIVSIANYNCCGEQGKSLRKSLSASNLESLPSHISAIWMRWT